MLRAAFIVLLATALTTSYPYNSNCRNWCYGGGQQNFVGPQLCSSYCGGYGGHYGSSCCSGSQYPYAYRGPPVGPISWPGYGYYGQYPVNQGQMVMFDPNGIVPIPSPVPVKVTVDTGAQKPKEWVCPVDNRTRTGPTYVSQQPREGLNQCQYDENCPNNPIRQKCCYDSSIGGKVCKPAILA